MAYLDLRDLAKEYVDLQERVADEDQINPLEEDEQDRLAALKELDDQLFSGLEDYAENEPTMIEDIDFEEYAQDFAYDVGYMHGEDNNPLLSYVDWSAWADSLKQDYAEVIFDGRTYLIRAY